MYHTSAKLTFGGGEKIFGVQKAPGGAKKPIRKTEKNSGDLFLIFRTVKMLYFVGAPKSSAGVTEW